jgi:ABC-type glycerol-3-phosphate transport system substrate-binding protein
MIGSGISRSRVLRAGVTALAGSLAAACGAPAASGDKTTAIATQAPATPAARNVTLIVDNDWISGDRLTIIKAWLERANKLYPNVKTDLRDVAGDQSKTIALFAADQQGDLYQMDQHLIPVFGPKNVLFDISSTLASLKFDVDNLVHDVNNITHFNGKRHGILLQLNVSTVVYNKNAFQESGLAEPVPAWTWDDYVALAQKLNKPTENRYGTNVVPGYPYSWFWSANVPYMDAKGTQTYWDTPASREILQWYADLTTRHRVAPAPREATEKGLNFNLGNYAMAHHIVSTPAIAKAVEGKFTWALAPNPKHPKTGKSVFLVTGHNYLVTKKGADRGIAREAAQVLIELFSPEIQEMYISGLSVSSLPTLKSVAANASKMPGMPDMKVAIDAITNGQNFDKVVGFLDFHNAFGPKYTEAFNGDVSVEQAAINMRTASDAALNQAAR